MGRAGELKVLGKSESTHFIVAGYRSPGADPGAAVLRARGARAGRWPAGRRVPRLVPLGGGRWGVAVGDVTAQAQGGSVPVTANVGVVRAVMRAMAQADSTPSMVLAA